ncbi:hypothetical protein CGZ94_07505 [Enemella evansiae]|uniref:Uncharacterized protein n=2 Tax=Enemella evansiae TaxID=2016499 RepID=A0A255GFU2_9ACTN|nr:hypothetical protein [Enemella evansiae]OYN98898.1 hypothetical protein CGZ96_06380 [Enemella evansiae]OYO07538.1 hypothetical protein CGZ98_19035 [Enemella evansiae]OYO14441.1 hypothetical protein CGZ94_07505 [Enemella evansiae]
MTDPAAARPAVCAGCGRTPRADEGGAPTRPPWTWSNETEGGRQLVRCPDCTRTHARSIEARLDESWWDRPAPRSSEP